MSGVCDPTVERASRVRVQVENARREETVTKVKKVKRVMCHTQALQPVMPCLLDRMAWEKTLRECDEPFSVFSTWMKVPENKEALRINQESPLTLLAIIPKNRAIIGRLNSIHRKRNEEFEENLAQLRINILTKNWKDIDWEWEFSITDNADIEKHIERHHSGGSGCPDFIRRVDITELANYLYLTNQISKKQLLLVHTLRHMHFICNQKSGETEKTKNVLVRFQYPTGQDETVLEQGVSPYYGDSTHEFGCKFDDLFTKNKTRLEMPDDKKVSFDDVFDEFGVDFSHVLLKMTNPVTEKEVVRGVGVAAYSTQLMEDVDNFQIVPTIGVYTCESYFAYSLRADQESGKFSRFVFLGNPALARVTCPHSKTSIIGIMLHDGFHLGQCKSENKYGWEPVRKVAKDKTVEQLKVFAKERFYHLLVVGAVVSHLTDDYGVDELRADQKEEISEKAASIK